MWRGLARTFSGESAGQGAEREFGDFVPNFRLLRKSPSEPTYSERYALKLYGLGYFLQNVQSQG